MEERQPGFNALHGYTLPEFVDNAPTRWGHAFEDEIIALAEKANAVEICDREMFFSHDFEIDHLGFIEAVHQDYPVTCHIDGRYFTRPKTLHEGKTTSSFVFREKWGEPGTNKVPRTAQIQVQHQMICAGAEMNNISVLVFPETQDHWEKKGITVELKRGIWRIMQGGQELDRVSRWAQVFANMGSFHQYPCEAQRDAQKLLLDAYQEFWNKNIIEGIEPNPKTYDDVKRAFPEPKGTIVCSDEPARWFKELSSINDEIGDGGMLAKRYDSVRVRILDWARKQDGCIDEDSRKATIFRDETGKKLGQFSKNKNGVLSFRPSD